MQPQNINIGQKTYNSAQMFSILIMQKIINYNDNDLKYYLGVFENLQTFCKVQLALLKAISRMGYLRLRDKPDYVILDKKIKTFDNRLNEIVVKHYSTSKINTSEAVRLSIDIDFAFEELLLLIKRCGLLTRRYA